MSENLLKKAKEATANTHKTVIVDEIDKEIELKKNSLEQLEVSIKVANEKLNEVKNKIETQNEKLKELYEQFEEEERERSPIIKANQAKNQALIDEAKEERRKAEQEKITVEEEKRRTEELLREQLDAEKSLKISLDQFNAVKKTLDTKDLELRRRESWLAEREIDIKEREVKLTLPEEKFKKSNLKNSDEESINDSTLE